MNYLQKLEKTARDANSIVCMGMDPVLKALLEDPKVVQFYGLLTSIVQKALQTGILPGAYKPNHGFYTVHDLKDPRISNHFPGSETLLEIMEEIKSLYARNMKESLIILDAKQGDIGPSSANYAKTDFDGWKADACTVSPYMGEDSLAPFAEYCNKSGKGVYILTRTSNPGAGVVQNLRLHQNNGTKPRYLYHAIADMVIGLSMEYPGVGAVVGATSLKELEDLAGLFAPYNIPLLIPGVGGQGGSAKEVTDILRKVGYPLYLARINSSSGITHPWVKAGTPMPEDYVDVCLNEIEKLNKEIGPIF